MQSSENVSILSSRNNRLKISASRAVKVKVFSPQSHLHSFKLCSVTHCGMAIHFYLLPFLLNCWCYNWFQNTKNRPKLDLVKNGLNDQNICIREFYVSKVTKNRLIRTKMTQRQAKWSIIETSTSSGFSQSSAPVCGTWDFRTLCDTKLLTNDLFFAD